jgi:toxin YoeB
MRMPFEGIGKPEALKENLAGFWSRRIDDTNRLVYAVDDVYLQQFSGI